MEKKDGMSQKVTGVFFRDVADKKEQSFTSKHLVFSCCRFFLFFVCFSTQILNSSVCKNSCVLFSENIDEYLAFPHNRNQLSPTEMIQLYLYFNSIPFKGKEKPFRVYSPKDSGTNYV